MRRYPERFWGQGSIPHRRLTQISPLLTLSLKVISRGIFAVLAAAVNAGSRSRVEFSIRVGWAVLHGGSGF